MVQTKAVWDAAGYSVAQVCTWPAETSTITVTPNAGQTQIPVAMHIRIPWWALKDVSIKLNGVEVAAKYLPSSYVEIPARVWTANDKVEVSMPFVESIDYAPDKSAGFWAGTIFYGPLAMTGTGAWSEQAINHDLSNIRMNRPVDYADSAANTPGNNRNVYTMNLLPSNSGNQANTSASVLQPDYYRDSAATKYFRINIDLAGIDRTALFAKIGEAKEFPAASYAPAGFADLQTAIAAAVVEYQNEDATRALLDIQIASLQGAIDDLVPNVIGKATLLELINQALALKAAQEAWGALNGAAFAAAWDAFVADPGNDDLGLAVRALVEPVDAFAGRPAAPYGYARAIAQIAQAQAAYDNEESTYAQVTTAYNALSVPVLTHRPGYMPEPEDLVALGLNALIVQAKAFNGAIYRPSTYEALLEALEDAEERAEAINVGSSTINLSDIPRVSFALQAAIDGLRIPVTSLSINAPVATNVVRGGKYSFGVNLNAGAVASDIDWTVNNTSLATVNPDKSITILNKTGTVLLTATAPEGLTYSIMLRIL